MRALLEVAKCPCCDGSGGRYDNYGNAEQCQWCYERSVAIAAPGAPADLPECGCCGQTGECDADCDARQAAATAPVVDGTTSDKYRAELYDEVWQRARDMGCGNVTEALVELERLKAAAPAVQADEECAHEFVPFRSGCTKCGEPYAAPVVQAEQEPVAVITGESFDCADGKGWRPSVEFSVKTLPKGTQLYAAPPAHDAALVEALRNLLSDDDIRHLRRFQDICEDSDADGHDLPKEAVRRLERAGTLRACGFGRHETTLFGDAILAALAGKGGE